MANSTLTQAEVERRLSDLGDGWAGDSTHLVGTFQFKTFPDGIDFVRQVADAAEELNHHPDIDVRWTTVVLDVSTHSAGGVTELDFALAENADEIVAGGR